jgi:hypothetical protein
MARPIKIGLDYFNLDTNVFSDRKIRRLVHVFGTKGFTIYIFVLCAIFDDKGYFVQCDDDFLFDIQDRFNLKENLVNQVINYSVKLELFSAAMYQNFKILTSKSIQDRYVLIMTQSKRNFKIHKNYNLLVNLEENLINSEETPINSEETPINSEFGTQKKEKEKKEKKIKKIYISASKQISSAQRDIIFEIFLFKKFINPHLEVDKFLDHYSMIGWCDKSGNKIKDIFAAARVWKQKEPGPGYQLPTKLHENWSKVYKIFKDLQPDNYEYLLKVLPTDFDGETLFLKVLDSESVKKLENDYFTHYQVAIKEVFKKVKLQYHV